MPRIRIEDLRVEADLSQDEQQQLLGGAFDTELFLYNAGGGTRPAYDSRRTDSLEQRGTYYIGVSSVGNENGGSPTAQTRY